LAKLKNSLIAVSLAVLSSAALAGAAEPNAQETTDFKEIYKLYTTSQFEPAMQRINAFEHNFPQSTQLPQVENLQGLVYLLGKQPAQAIPHFQRAIALGKQNKVFVPYVTYNLAKAYFEADQLNEAQKALTEISPESLDLDNQIKVHYLRARVFAKRNNPRDAAREALSASRLILGTSLQAQDARAPLSSLLDEILKQMNNLPAVEDLYHEFQDAPIADALLFYLGSRQISLGNREQGAARLQTLIASYPQSAYYAQASDLVRSAQDNAVVDSSAIGVLIPLKGKFASFGEKTRHAVELAFDIFNADKPDSKVTLVVEDSGEEADQTIKAIDRLVNKHHVLAIIGPLLSKGIDSITQHAQEIGVPLISLARFPGVQGDWIFPAGVSLKQQAQEIARYAIQTLEMKRFAIIHPQDKVGEETAQDFWRAVEALGGEVRGIESYGSAETDFRVQVDKLSGLHYSEARLAETQELAKIREKEKIKKRTRKTEKYFALPPVVDYDAVFIPDDPKISSQILPTFAYRDVDKMKFLGTSAWDSAELSARAQSSAEGAVFPEAFYANSEASSVKKFVERFQQTYGYEPSTMEAQAYDAGALLRSVLTQGTTNRGDLRDRLKNVKGFNGATGRISYTDGALVHELKILTVKNGKIVPVK